MIEVDGVSKSYGANPAARDVTFTAPRGSVTGFVGKNGAGKSTVLNIIAGVIAPDRGSVRIDGAPFSAAATPAATVGFLLDAERIPSHITAHDFLAYLCDTQRVPRTAIAAALDFAGIGAAAHHRIGTFSLGMRQRLGIAAATLPRPSILVLDEPINGLDPEGIQWLRSVVTAAAQSGAAVLLSSHHMAELALVADRIVMIDSGRIVAEGPLAEFTSTEHLPEVYVESDDLPALAAVLRSAGWHVEERATGAIVTGASPEDVGRAAFGNGVGLRHLSVAARTLEESYFDRVALDREGITS